MPTLILLATEIKSAEDLNLSHARRHNLILGSESGLYVDASILNNNDHNLNKPTHKKTPIVKPGVAMNPEWNHPMWFKIEFGDADKGFLTLVAQIKANVNEVEDILIAEVRVNIKELLDKDPDNAEGEKHLSYVVTSPSGETKGSLNFCFQFGQLIFPLSHAVPAAAPVAGHGCSATSAAAYPPPGSSHLHSSSVLGCPTWSPVVQPTPPPPYPYPYPYPYTYPYPYPHPYPYPYPYPEQQPSIVGRLARRLAEHVGFEFLTNEGLNWESSGDGFNFGDGFDFGDGLL